MNFDRLDRTISKEWLGRWDIIKTGHFMLTSGRHSDIYCNKDLINPNPLVREAVTMDLTTVVEHDVINQVAPNEVSSKIIITGPAVAGAIWALPVANALGTAFVYPEKGKVHNGHNIADIMEFRRGYDKFLEDRLVIIVEDIITTGKSVNLTADAIKKCGGLVSAVVAIWNRTGKTFDFPSFALINDKVDDWDRDDCPLCAGGIPLTNPKTGKVITTDITL